MSAGAAVEQPEDEAGRGSVLAGLVLGRQILICAGPGGVGKTTTAAAIALHAARLGRRACVVTIDPAKRLADALGLDQLTNEPHQVQGDWQPTGELWALMFDTKTTFDDVVARNAGSREQAEAILGNRLYRNISGALGGTQEYMAMEKLYELHREGGFDLVVVDTPPTRHALDFLDAPARLTRFLDNRVFRLLMTPTRAGLRAIGLATQMFLRATSKAVGGAIVADAVAFFEAFEGMEQGFRDRAAKVEELLVDGTTAFVLVSSPRREAVDETLFFADRLYQTSGGQTSGGVEALIVNRMFPYFGPVPDGLRDFLHNPGLSAREPARLGALAANLEDLDRVASREQEQVKALSERLPGAAVIQVPFLADDVHDVDGLTEVCRWLFGPEPKAGT
jgi:anion-transporting  ArsA/GET3 family ATPase